MKKNITSSFKNITGDLTGVKKIVSARIKNMTFLMVMIFCGVMSVLFVCNAYASVQFSVEVPSDPVLEINIPSNPIVIDVTPTTSAPGFSSNDITVSVGTNNPTGYSLTMETENTDLTRNPVSAGESTSTISTLADNTGGYTESSFTTNAWGYKFSTGNYYGIPSSLDLLSNTTATNGDSKTITFAAKVDGSKPAGAYETLLKFVAVASYVPGLYTINFEPGDSGSGEMSPQLINGGQTATLNTNTFTREGYDFSGWLGSDGNTYTDGQSITAPLAGGSLTLTAQWKKPIYIQDFTKAMCQDQASSAPVTVIDRRDGSDYTVRYINGACWMTQNLRITKSTGQADWTISSTDSNFTRVSTWNVHVSDLSAGNSYTAARSHVPTVTDADTNGNKPMNTYTAEQIGVWYNYCAASAGQVCSETKTNATQDICPLNWHLPPNGTSAGQIGSVRSYKDAFNPIYGGGWSNGSLYNATTYGYWWSATAYNSSYQYLLYYYNGSLNTSYDIGNYKYRGYYIRCTRTS